jgi:hypothetical protein
VKVVFRIGFGPGSIGGYGVAAQLLLPPQQRQHAGKAVCGQFSLLPQTMLSRVIERWLIKSL